jgi:hypothetical protein
MKHCFVICPINKPESDQRRRSDLLLKHVIKPVVKKLGFEVHRADLSPLRDPAKTIEENISSSIFRADLVVADLSDLNANVLYELGKRHAWGKPCVHLTCDDYRNLPFDIRNYNVIQYDLSQLDRVEGVKAEIQREIRAWEIRPIQAPSLLTPDDIIRLTNSTVVAEIVHGKRDHYYVAQKLASKPCNAMFLMQRSSSLLLGPEKGWEAERAFYDVLREKVAGHVEFYHIVSLEGIQRHLDRPVSVFPDTEQALSHLMRMECHGKEVVAVKNLQGVWPLKRVPEDSADSDLKPDRQARTFMIRGPNGSAEGVVVLDLGGIQVSFHMLGPSMNEFFQTCLKFYREECPVLTWDEVERVVRGAARSVRTGQ